MKANYGWAHEFQALYEKAIAQYRGENRDAEKFFTKSEKAFLTAIGARPMELYDFAEDAADLDFETALLITAARRDYFLVVQTGRASSNVISVADLPPKTDELKGIVWLPRIIQKAEAKLRGEMPNELMYCCGGDRRFFKTHDIHPADFLRVVWAADGDEAKVLAYVKGQR